MSEWLKPYEEIERLRAEIERLRAIIEHQQSGMNDLAARNAELLAALKWIVEDGATDARATECARAAIAEGKP